MKKQNIIIVLLFFFVLTLAVGYIIFRTDAEVSQKTVPAKNLNIIFKSVGSVTEVDCTNSTAVISYDKKYVSVNVPNLLKKGAYAEFPITVKNVGTLPARLVSINEYGYGSDAIDVSYNGIDIDNNILYPGDEINFKLKVSMYRAPLKQISNYDFVIKFNYIQA